MDELSTAEGQGQLVQILWPETQLSHINQDDKRFATMTSERCEKLYLAEAAITMGF